jgi:hypothetical protein
MDKISVLVLDYNRPIETELCLNSIKNYCKVPHEVIYLCNGSDNSDYAFDFYKRGLIDKLIINKENNGGGFGTVQLVNNSFNKYILWIECDCELQATIEEEGLNSLIKALQSDFACIDLTGGICGFNIYSGRCFFMDRERYNSIKKDENGVYGGPGPYNSTRYLESFIQEYFKNNGLKVGHVTGLIKDNGKWSIRQVGDGIYRHRCDTKQMYIIKTPTYMTEEYPPFDKDLEWPNVLAGKWIDGEIPLKWKNLSFQYWK